MDNIETVKQVAYDLAYFYQQKYGNCAQCTLAAIKNTVGPDVITDEVFRAVTGLAGGFNGAGYTCGALAGGAAAISCFWGRDISEFPDPKQKRFKTFNMCRRLAERFEEEYGPQGGLCPVIQTKIMGRSFDIGKGDRDAYLAAGGHDDKCTAVCGKAAMWVIEILNDEGLI